MERSFDIRLQAVSDPRQLCAIRGLVRGYFRSLGFADRQCEDIVLAVDEACANCIRHSYAGRSDGIILIELRAEDSFTSVSIADEGAPAEVQRVAPKDAGPPNADTVEPGGLGLQLMYKVFDEVHFSPGEKRGNVVKMRIANPKGQRDAACNGD